MYIYISNIFFSFSQGFFECFYSNNDIALHEYYVYVRGCLECGLCTKHNITTCAPKLACSSFIEAAEAVFFSFYIKKHKRPLHISGFVKQQKKMQKGIKRSTFL